MTTEKTAFPLYWPDGKPRTKFRNTNTKFKASFADARDECLREIRLLGGRKAIISTNIPLKRDGLPQSMKWGQTVPDPGVAVYFERNGKELCFACDCWRHPQDNMRAIVLTIEALRGIARWGTGDMMESAFRGFAALPAVGESSGEKPWEVLGVPINAGEEQVKDAYRSKAKILHPDIPGTGDANAFGRLQRAADLMLQNLQRQ